MQRGGSSSSGGGGSSSSARERLVLITGACGVVGSILRYHWHTAGFMLRLVDRVEPRGNLLPHESFVQFDLESADDCRRVCEGVHTIVHLAADAGSQDFMDSLLPKNVVRACCPRARLAVLKPAAQLAQLTRT
jgi:hypothetical protein